MRKYDNSKTKAVRASVVEGVQKLGLLASDDEDGIWHELKVTDPTIGKQIATVRFHHRYSWSDVSIRVEHAGMPFAKEYSWEAKRHQQDPYCTYSWTGRNYKIASSVVNAIDKFRATIPSDHAAKLACLTAEVLSEGQDVRYCERNFIRSFTVSELAYLLDLATATGSPKVRLKSARAEYAELLKARKSLKKAETKARVFEASESFVTLTCDSCEAACDDDELNDNGVCETCIDKGVA